MNRIKFVIVLFFLVFVSCSKEDGTCPCIKNSTQPLFSGNEVDSRYCTGELENPSPGTIIYERVCD